MKTTKKQSFSLVLLGKTAFCENPGVFFFFFFWKLFVPGVGCLSGEGSWGGSGGGFGGEFSLHLPARPPPHPEPFDENSKLNCVLGPNSMISVDF